MFGRNDSFFYLCFVGPNKVVVGLLVVREFVLSDSKAILQCLGSTYSELYESTAGGGHYFKALRPCRRSDGDPSKFNF